MEWFWRFMDSFQKSAFGMVLQSLAPVDWVILVLVFWGAIQGSRKGFCEMFGKLMGIFLVSMLTLSLYPKVAAYLNANLPVLSTQISAVCAFYLMAVFLWLSVSWCMNFFGKFIKVEAQGPLKALAGSLLGILHMVLLLSFIAQILLFLPIDPLQDMFKQGRTYAGYSISRVVPELHKLVKNPFHQAGHRIAAGQPETRV